MPVEYEVKYIQLHDGPGNFLFRVKRGNSNRAVVFFPGDISDLSFTSSHQMHLECQIPLYEFSLENICWILSSYVGELHDIVVIRASVLVGGYSLFSNFVICDSFGTPDWEEMRQNRHMCHPGDVLTNLLGCLQENEETYKQITLIGFSKGCVVILSLLEERNLEILERVEKIVLIDPGTAREGRTFPFTQDGSLTFRYDIPISVYVSPYQFNDPNRLWLKEEILDFVDKSGAELCQILTDHPVSIETHFKAIKVALEIENIS